MKNNRISFADFQKTFFNGKTNKKEYLKQLKVVFTSFEDLLKFSKQFEKEIPSAKSLFNQVLLGKYYLPKSYSELGINEKQYFTDSLEQEMNWQALAFLKCFDVINQFIKLKDEFEHNLLLGKYEQARTILEEVEKDICVSYWSIENRFILDEYQFGSEKNWETRNTILEEKNYDIVRILGDMYSVKAEKRVSFFQYNESIDDWESHQAIYGLSEGFQNYMRFKANYFSYSIYNQLTEALFRESDASVIDRYLLFIRISQHYILTHTQKDNNFIFLLRKLNEAINDIAIEQMLISVDTSYNFIKSTNNKIISIIDEYTKGNYAHSKKLSKEYLCNHASHIIELCEIYVKSLIELDCDYEVIINNDIFLNQICKVYFDILKKAPNTDNALVDLVKLAYTFNNSHIGMQLYSFLKEELGWKTNIDYSFLARLNSKFTNPKLLGSLFQNVEISQNFIQNLSALYLGSVTVQLFSDFYKYHLSNTTGTFANIPFTKNEIYQIRNLMLLNEYDKCIARYVAILNQENLSMITHYEVISNLFFCYMSQNDYRNCIILYVNIYLTNNHLTKKMNVTNVLEIVIKEKFRNLTDKQSLIELPIFLKNVCNDKLKVKQSYELFLKANNCAKPSELILLESSFDKSKFVYFLRNVCVTEIMQLSTMFESTEKVNAERIIICQFLAQYDKDNFDFYNSEIATLTQKNMVSKVIAKIDEGKIYVNEEKIKKLFLANSTKGDVSKLKEISERENSYLTKDFFDRTLDLKYFAENNKFKNTNKLLLLQINEKGEFESNQNPAFNDFKKMFLEIRNHFLANREFGLDSYLSTRIRHGTLINHIRSVFEQYHLITTQIDGIYVPNEYWVKIEEFKGEVDAILSNFSKNTDALLNHLKEDLIQYKTEQKNDKSQGLFDYIYKDDFELGIIYMSEINSFEEFIDLSFVYLRNKTDEMLSKIQIQLNNDIKEKFVNLLTEMENDLVKLGSKNLFIELLNNINICRTEIQNKLNYISKWFRRSESSFDGEYELGILTETSIQITKNVNPNYHFKLDKNICESVNIKGEYHQHIIDLMNICLFNIIKHSELPCENLNARLSIQEQEDKLRMVFENRVADVEKHSTKLLTIKNNWEKSDMNVSQEGGTGFPKIKKIIHSDLGRKESNFSFVFDNQKLTIELSFELNDLKI